MTDADYKAFLHQVEAALPKWEVAYKGIDPEKNPQISYSQGKYIVMWRDLGLMEIGNIRLSVAKLQVKRTVSGELALLGFLESLFNSAEEEVDFGAIIGLPLSNLEALAPEWGTLILRIGNDVNARVALLEQGACP